MCLRDGLSQGSWTESQSNKPFLPLTYFAKKNDVEKRIKQMKIGLPEHFIGAACFSCNYVSELSEDIFLSKTFLQFLCLIRWPIL